jgi:phosphonate transport system ATP-binding protein
VLAYGLGVLQNDAIPTDAIVVEQVSKSFGDRAALRSIGLRIRSGERVALLGASGSGKSTLIRLLCGLERMDAGSGRIEVLGRPLQDGHGLTPNPRLIRQDVGVIFQQFNLVGRLPVLTNVLTGLSARTPLWRLLSGQFRIEDKARALDALRTLGLEEQAFQRASTLSGGQQQRAAIARVLLQRARVVLADEPVASLDPESTLRVMDHLAELNVRQGMTLVVSLHHVELARRYCERVVALRDGSIIFDGPTSALDADLLERLYGAGARELLEPVAQPQPMAQRAEAAHTEWAASPA